MATPVFQIQTSAPTFFTNQAGSLRILTKTPSGTAVNVSSGYTVGFIEACPSANPNKDVGGISLTSNMTAAFDTTGVTLSWTQAQAGTISGLLQSLNNQLIVAISNDSGTTSSLISNTPFNIQNVNNML